MRLSVPGVPIDAPVVPVSLNSDGSLDVPRDARAVGWWKDSAPLAGGHGSTVIDGHRDTRRGAAVFAGLTAAAPGDLVRLVTTTGAIDYRVSSVRARHGSELPPDVLSADVPHRLVLVTCVGPFTPGSGYRDRLFVIARPVSKPGVAGASAASLRGFASQSPREFAPSRLPR